MWALLQANATNDKKSHYGSWGPNRCHSCDMCKALNECPEHCLKQPVKLAESVSGTFSELWAAIEQHASTTLIAFVVTHVPFVGESDIDLRC